MVPIYEDSIETYFFLEYSRSHNQLVIRAKRNNVRKYNIDLLFKGVQFIIAQTQFNGIKVIHETSEESVDAFIVKHSLNTNTKGNILFRIDNGTNESSWILCRSFGVFHSKVDILESIIGRYDDGGFEDEEQVWITRRTY